MPALNVQFTDDELARVRTAASRSGSSLKLFAHDAIMAAADNRASRVTEAFEYVTARSSELNRRLA
ncbi:antitoxin Phd [Candidatus Mycolicibacterium alkanivorans]|uniref:Antitoxin Phd n=1 Tax=Candidatus Mycolicibacterium alkanivorans TaxID=2954114 RepID=A0ABS9YY98_9MYCO|nr:antitoxin Phd [Candidatus Mycolicibacterium alkanivorans]MCI4676225.1 antitoxin Phd [Candidatus Mycolicibacterium alkanivorans]